MTDIKIKLFRHRETKNTIVYHAWLASTRQDVKGSDPIDTLCIQKTAFQGEPPAQIVVTVNAA